MCGKVWVPGSPGWGVWAPRVGWLRRERPVRPRGGGGAARSQGVAEGGSLRLHRRRWAAPEVVLQPPLQAATGAPQHVCCLPCPPTPGPQQGRLGSPAPPQGGWAGWAWVGMRARSVSGCGDRNTHDERELLVSCLLHSPYWDGARRPGCALTGTRAVTSWFTGRYSTPEPRRPDCNDHISKEGHGLGLQHVNLGGHRPTHNRGNCTGSAGLPHPNPECPALWCPLGRAVASH